MKEMTLQDMHKYCLEIAKDVHSFCEANNIKYSLGYGSLLGAVRHKGYIPWDDDIDILMPRPDYDRFCKIYTSSRFKLATPENAYIAYSRVFDNNDTFCRTLGRWLKYEREGAFVDVFPLDAVSADFASFISQRDRAHKVLQMQLDNRGAKKNLLDLFRILPIKEAMKSLKVTLHNRYHYDGETDMDSINRQYQEIMTENKWEDAQYCALLAYINRYSCKQLPITIWDGLILTSFEDTEFYIFKEYDSVLKTLYGENYMEIPPKEKREQHALAISRFYFKQ